jgi:DNA polymerase III delta prime subunit
MATDVATHLCEKYRPRRIADCVLLPEDRESFESFIAKGNAPHILLVGPPGVGKTSVAMALANDMQWQWMKKNAAAYTNIEAVRTEIAEFALPPSHLLLPFLNEDDDRHRCVFLDEGDHIPTKAQAALRGIMEEAAATGHANFIMTANDGNKIDTAIRSRCAVFDFSYSEPADRTIITSCFRGRTIEILDAEGLEPDGEIIDRLLKKHGLDFRAVLNEIQKYT